MSHQAQGFVRNERFGDGPVIKGTNRETTRKWLALGIPDVADVLVNPGACSQCGATCCRCTSCTRLFGELCATCANVPGWQSNQRLSVEAPDGQV